jgi:hypothetical protein
VRRREFILRKIVNRKTGFKTPASPTTYLL